MEPQQQIDDWIEDHREDLATFLLEFATVSSPRGYEREAAEYLSSWLQSNGIETRLQPVVGDRVNVVGKLPGSQNESASRVVFNGHLDTAYGNAEEDDRVLPDRLRSHTSAWRDEDDLFGVGVINDKGPMTAFLWAALAVEASNVSPAGDIYLTASAGEIGGTTTDESWDPRTVGSGIGTRRLVDGGITGDYAIVAETTDYAIARMECGVVWFEITITGSPTYQPRLAAYEPDTVMDEHPGALPAASKAVRVLEQWGSEYSNSETKEYDHGTMRPSAGVGAIESGNPNAPIVAPGTATLYLDVRLPPEAGPELVRDEIDRVLMSEGIDATVEPYLFRRGYIADDEAVSPLTTTLSDAHYDLFDETPPDPQPMITSMWRDINVFNEVGVPAVTCGPPRTTREFEGTTHPCMHLDDLVAGAKLYARAMVDLCCET
ncbi:M20 family metallopeptidase [Natrialba swarupiae]|uniref:M20/M25/M40 family metallo-hydrolase n=1 Tax=Natrialba swarupiae TaxID=2448032 RepID=A0A5D5AP16_9EURY|nr:M20/M25/M40 family metallo-hydrolase [Natrialba swarupiae]TYT62625.1 M20/M25/M40 family metallo-hydrolase [Natrialba swarupiae]